MEWNYDSLRRASLLLRALQRKGAAGVLKYVVMHGPVTVTDIVHRLRIDQSVVSQILRGFRNGGLVDTERDGKWMIYQINAERFEEVSRVCTELSEIRDGVRLSRKDQLARFI